jgi:hypothetical protein
MSLLKPVTHEEAKRVWVSIPNPSARRVAKALTQSGRRVHHSTIARWRAQDWRPVANSLHPLNAARQAIDVATGVLTGDPVAGVEAFLGQNDRQQELPITQVTGTKMSDHPSPRHSPDLIIPLLVHLGRSATQQLGGRQLILR